MVGRSPSGGTAAALVILLTGFSRDDLQRRAASIGAVRALLEPWLPEAVLREVRRTLKRLPQA